MANDARPASSSGDPDDVRPVFFRGDADPQAVVAALVAEAARQEPAFGNGWVFTPTLFMGLPPANWKDARASETVAEAAEFIEAGLCVFIPDGRWGLPEPILRAIGVPEARIIEIMDRATRCTVPPSSL